MANINKTWKNGNVYMSHNNSKFVLAMALVVYSSNIVNPNHQTFILCEDIFVGWQFTCQTTSWQLLPSRKNQTWLIKGQIFFIHRNPKNVCPWNSSWNT